MLFKYLPYQLKIRIFNKDVLKVWHPVRNIQKPFAKQRKQLNFYLLRNTLGIINKNDIAVMHNDVMCFCVKC